MTPLIISIAGKSNAGKTTFLEKLIAELTHRGYRIGSVKHTHDGFELDNKGKDSWRHKKAGAQATLVVTDKKIALVKDDLGSDIEKMRFYLSDMDLILAEGFKRQPLPKIEVFRAGGPHEYPLCLDSPDLIAFVTDATFTPPVPIFGLEDVVSVASFIQERYLGHK
ncbi:MAG: molybdopterin-guanine dinucleotide biosynthesis protein B [Desulfotignum sp.]|nr:molybdopterin-guanine dinucleotide biosynthesis protein B [Desulfotignum sp.]MCF8112443.1 molybdopterin-guanine dinucleotide biosynthesis protein B [Desulfotignum sp.]MCF8124818.1 molybdopterin-guanine dinucleotide biosynthesis protein B [Desulfotignum sp.]